MPGWEHVTLAMTGAIGTESLKVGGTQFWGIQLLVG